MRNPLWVKPMSKAQEIRGTSQSVSLSGLASPGELVIGSGAIVVNKKRRLGIKKYWIAENITNSNTAIWWAPGWWRSVMYYELSHFFFVNVLFIRPFKHIQYSYHTELNSRTHQDVPQEAVVARALMKCVCSSTDHGRHTVRYIYCKISNVPFSETRRYTAI